MRHVMVTSASRCWEMRCWCVMTLLCPHSMTVACCPLHSVLQCINNITPVGVWMQRWQFGTKHCKRRIENYFDLWLVSLCRQVVRSSPSPLLIVQLSERALPRLSSVCLGAWLDWCKHQHKLLMCEKKTLKRLWFILLGKRNSDNKLWDDLSKRYMSHCISYLRRSCTSNLFLSAAGWCSVLLLPRSIHHMSCK